MWTHKDTGITFKTPSVKLDEMLALSPMHHPLAAVIRILKAGASLSPHRDYNPEGMRRFHWVIETNPDCLMMWPDERVIVNLLSGRIYEVNVSIEHLVMNLGTTDRTHIVADYCPGVEIIESVGTTGTPVSTGGSCTVVQIGPRATKIRLNGEIIELGPNSTVPH